VTTNLFTFTRAAAKSATSRLRDFGIFPARVDWTARAVQCERCPLRVVRCGVSYCGKPFLAMPLRDPATDGCGCPTIAKAKDPSEHCPLDARHQPAATSHHGCNCKWCVLQ
jgi:hypothetical protein